MPKSDLFVGVIAMDEDDLNWCDWVVVAHEDEKMVLDVTLAKEVKNFYIGLTQQEEDDFDIGEGTKHIVTYFHNLGYTVFPPTTITWGVPVE